MLTLYHAPKTRSLAIVQLIHEMGIEDQVTIKTVEIQRQDGAGSADPDNPHPEKKVPLLIDGTVQIRERGAIILYLTDMFAQNNLGRPVGDPQRGDYLSWLFYYQGVMEPTIIFSFAQLSHPALFATFRDYDTMIAHLDGVLSRQPYLMGDTFSAVDLLCFGPFAMFGEKLPVPEAMQDWVTRCSERESYRKLIISGL